MKTLSKIEQIQLPVPKPNTAYSITLLDRAFTFSHLKHILGAADISKAGDRKAGLAADNEIEREAARAVLSSLTLQHFYDNPLTNIHEKIDSVMAINYDINHAVFSTISHLTLGELKDELLSSNGAHIRKIGTALTGVMVAALTKLLDVHELIHLAKKLKHGASTKARTAVGLPKIASPEPMLNPV